MVSIKEEIIPNTPFQSTGPLLVIWSVSDKETFCDTRDVLLIGTFFIFPNDRHEYFMKIEMNKPLEAHEQIASNS